MDAHLTFIFLVVFASSTMPAPFNSANPSKNSNSALTRLKRSYFPYTARPIYDDKYQPISMYKPPMYALSRPYYVPVFGAPGRVPIYFPPQPLSARFPDDDNAIHKTPFKGPAYLPPAPSTAPPSGGKVNMTFDNRFNKDMEEEDERPPIWGVVKNEQAPAGNGRPTRPPTSGTATAPPPLVHATNNKRPESQNNQIYFDNNSPSAVMLHVDGDTGSFAPPAAAAAPPQQPPTKEGASVVKQDDKSPGPCVWAIISCCSAASDQIRYNCFEQRGCGGAFWGVSPCDSELAQSAIAAALNYYNSN